MKAVLGPVACFLMRVCLGSMGSGTINGHARSLHYVPGEPFSILDPHRRDRRALRSVATEVTQRGICTPDLRLMFFTGNR